MKTYKEFCEATNAQSEDKNTFERYATYAFGYALALEMDNETLRKAVITAGQVVQQLRAKLETNEKEQNKEEKGENV